MILTVACMQLAAVWAADVPNYEDDIKPIFRDHCLQCHNPDEANADVDLSSFAAVMQGGSSGQIVKAGRPESSQLYQAMAHLDGAESMPPESPKLDETQLAIVREWIRGGLVAGKGGKSQLRIVGAMAAPAAIGKPSPLPRNLPTLAVAETKRPPVPQAIAASPGAPLFAVSGHEQVLLYAGTESQQDSQYQLIGVLPFTEGTIHDIKFSRSGSILVVAGGRGAHSGKTVLYDVASGERLGAIGDEVDSVLASDITTDHNYVAFGGPAKAVKIFSTKTGVLLHRIKKHTDWITAVSFSPDGKLLATGDRSGGIHIWETEKGAIVFTLDEHKVQIADLSWRADGKLLASAADDGNMVLWDMKDGFPSQNVVAHSQKSDSRYTRQTGVLAMQYCADGRLLTTGRNSTAVIWTPDSQKLMELKINEGLPVSAAILNGSTKAVIGSVDGTLHVWDLTTKQRVQTLINGK